MKKEDNQNKDTDFDCLPHEDERLLHDMLGMARRRKNASADADKAWCDFRRDVIGKRTDKRRFGMLHMVSASLCGAAAMLVLVLVFGFMPRISDTNRNIPDDGYVALQYKKASGVVSLQANGVTTTVDAGEAISFCSPQSFADTGDDTEKDKYKKISTPRGMGVKVILPDSSEVWLNADSYIEFPETFRRDSRIVAVNGEAFFKITHDETSPFIVKSSQIDVRVLGTEFNFNNYNGASTQVALVNGKVEILPPSGNRPLAVLSPGEAATCGDDGSIDVAEVDTYALTQWVDGFFYFDDVPMVEVLQELGRWYNLGVVFLNRRAMAKKVHFSALRTEPVETALESLNSLRIVDIRIDGHDIIVD